MLGPVASALPGFPGSAQAVPVGGRGAPAVTHRVLLPPLSLLTGPAQHLGGSVDLKGGEGGCRHRQYLQILKCLRYRLPSFIQYVFIEFLLFVIADLVFLSQYLGPRYK